MSLHEDIQKDIHSMAGVGPASEGILMRWVLIAQTIGSDGESYMFRQSSEGLQPWEMLGLMEGVRNGLIAERVAGEIECDD